MKYQLVLQWPASSIDDYDTLVEIENVITYKLGVHGRVDGHDAGSGQMNIFIHTDDPEATFKAIEAAIGTRDFWMDARVAYRALTDSEYTILWPKDLHEFNIS